MSRRGKEYDFGGKVALVTGGSRGLGKAIVTALASAGADVFIASRKLDSCEALAAELRARFDTKAIAYSVHVGHWDELEPMVDTAYRELGHVDILVNNAGMSPRYPSLNLVDESLFDKVLAVNLKGPFRLSGLVGARMVASGGGTIVNVSSISAIRPSRHELPYAAAKAGLNVITAGFALELGPKVRVNAIMAGPYLTDMAKSWDSRSLKSVAAQLPLARIGDPEEIVGATLYLASSASSFTTGSVMTVDGGASIAGTSL